MLTVKIALERKLTYPTVEHGISKEINFKMVIMSEKKTDYDKLMPSTFSRGSSLTQKRVAASVCLSGDYLCILYLSSGNGQGVCVEC